MRPTILVGVICCVSTQAASQSTDAGTFLTFGEVIDRVIQPGRSLVGCNGLDQTGTGTFYDSGLLPTLPPGWDDLSPALQAQCTKENNGIGGATLGGGFGGPFSTRTFLPLIIDTNRPDTGGDTTVVGRLDTGFAVFDAPVGPGAGRLGFGISGSLVDTETTEFGVGQSGESLDAFVSYSWGQAGPTRGGFAIDVGRTRTASGTIFDFSGNTLIRASGETDPSFVQQTLDNAEPVCNGLGRAEQDTEGFGLSAFFAQDLSRQTTLAIEGRFGRDYNLLSSPICNYRVGEQVAQDVFFAGIIDSDYVQTTLDVSVKLQTQRPAFGGVLTPRIGVAAQLTDTPGYTQTEQSAGDVTIQTVTADPLNAPLFGSITTQDTGLALTFDDSRHLRVVAELGSGYVVPLEQGTLSLDVGLFHRLIDDRTVTAHFADDGRSTPTTFSFDTRPSDKTYVEAGLGYQITTLSGWTAQVGGTILLWNSFEDQATLGFSMSRVF